MRFSGKSGQVTVMLCIILLAVIILAGVLVDASRIGAGRALVKKAADSAARSALANYSSKLKGDYGIFAIGGQSGEPLSGMVKDYMAKNLMIPEEISSKKGSLNLYGFRVENVSATPLFNLSENEIFRQQILEYMKYRAPKAIVEGFLDKLSAMKDMGKMSAAYKKKLGADKTLSSMDKAQQRLKKNVDGSGGANERFINGFNLNGSWMDAFNRYTGKYDSLKSLTDSLNEIAEQIAQLEAGRGNGEEGSDNDEAGKRLEELKRQLSAIEGSIAETENEIGEAWMDIRFSLTGDYVRPNEEAAENIGKVIETGEKAESALKELEAYLDGNLKDSGTFFKDFSTVTREDITKMRNLILDGQKASSMLEELARNNAVLQELSGKLDIVNSVIGRAGEGASVLNGLSGQLMDRLGDYNNSVDYEYIKPEKTVKEEDPRKGKAEAAKETLLEKLFEDSNYTDEGISKEELPSYSKVESDSFDAEDIPYVIRDTVPDSPADAGDSSVQYGEGLDGVGDQVDLYNEEGMFQENALGLVGDMGETLPGDLTKLRDNIYINEYIMGMFKNAVPAMKDESGNKNDTDLRGLDKKDRDTFYECEVEYILHGNASQNTNKIMTRAQILLVRFGLDTLHVYTDARKKELAAGIAAAVAGWWTGGAGIPVISNLIMCGWGMGEAVIDVKDLLDGEPVPIFKSQGDWKLDIGLPKDSGRKTDPRLSFTYYDYLRLFLLTMDGNKKLDRMEDLIQLNIGKTKNDFRISGCNTYIRVEAVVSMKYLFITQPFIPSSLKTDDGRYKFKVLVYEGY